MMMNSTLGQTLTQQQHLSPQLQQSIHILQISAAELADYLQEQSMGNPLLSVTWQSPGERKRKSAAGMRPDIGDDVLSRVRSTADTLESELLGQLRISGIDGRHLRIARYLAGNVDESGYVAVGLEETAAILGEPLEEIEEALRQLQSLEPAGIGARDLRECLLLQIAADSDANVWASAVVSECLADVAGGRLKKIAGKLGITGEQVNQAIDYIRGLDPRPGRRFGISTGTYIQPDAYIRKINGDYTIVLNESLLPKMSINPYYENLLHDNDCKEAKPFLSGSMQSAKWLIRSVEQRNATLYRVLETIVEKQVDFLEQGVQHLKPMNLKAIADRLDVHESTVSRAVRDKYVQTPQGLFELKYFFTTGLPTAGGDSTSAETIKAKIRLYIDGEDKRSPLSDQQMADMLAAEGIRISRRTVMKYREEMQLLSSRLRMAGTAAAGGRP
ncbi:RNA polymerase factor sigma-54 [Paenibacillus mesophilus]|uniref:RNA polymerase factor sigma-54 n=1 Tax=Paenibacillus mesophilus TaxID=2582849 RepID=UPI0013051227|nr:RNA polymerase factor sigma-54 [Paenibacillus mesophilus]